MKHLRLVGLAALMATLILSGCSTSKLPAPVVDLSSSDVRVPAPAVRDGASVYTPLRPGSVKDSGRTHVVAPGDTVYNISLRYGLDARQLASLNAVTDPTQLRIGQELRLPASVTQGQEPEMNPSVRINRVTNGTPPVSTPVPVVQAPESGSVDDTQVSTEAPPVVSANPVPVEQKKSPALIPGSRMIWPARGEVISDFAKNGKGLDIAGKVGDVVVAAAPGQVLFVGDGVKGYGNLVIIKHSPTLVTAYGHNSKVTVGLNEQVKAGQKIAELGATDAPSPRLRFEVRQAGKPTDPMTYLPARRH